MKNNNLTCCACFSSFISYCFLLFIGAIMSIVILNTKHVDVLVLRPLSEEFVTSVTAFVLKVMVNKFLSLQLVARKEPEGSRLIRRM